MKDSTQTQPATPDSRDTDNAASCSALVDKIHQLTFPREWRIDTPLAIPCETEGSDITEREEDDLQIKSNDTSDVIDHMVAEFATCLWYLKTKHFRREWKGDDNNDDDPRARRALGRITRGVDMLSKYGVEIDDPTNRRYPQGGENMMKPIEFQPTDGITFDRVTETVLPIVYHNDCLVQRGEVFVAVPREAPAPSAISEDNATPSVAGKSTADADAQHQDAAMEMPSTSASRGSETLPQPMPAEASVLVQKPASVKVPSGTDLLPEEKKSPPGTSESKDNAGEKACDDKPTDLDDPDSAFDCGQSDAVDSGDTEVQSDLESSVVNTEHSDGKEPAPSQDDKSSHKGNSEHSKQEPKSKTK